MKLRKKTNNVGTWESFGYSWIFDGSVETMDGLKGVENSLEFDDCYKDNGSGPFNKPSGRDRVNWMIQYDNNSNPSQIIRQKYWNLFYVNGRMRSREGGDQSVAFVQRANLHVLINGDYYKIPDLWLQCDGNGGTRLTGNWITYTAIGLWSPGHKITVYGYKDGDENQAWELAINTFSNGKDVVTKITPTQRIPQAVGDGPNYYLEFNYRLARKRLDSEWKFDINDLLETMPGNNAVNKLAYLYVAIPENREFACKTGILFDSITTESEPEYAGSHQLTNHLNQTVNMKSPDYQRTYTDSYAFTSTNTITAGGSISWAFKAGVAAVIDATRTTTITVNVSYTHTWTDTWTETNTRTYTVSGQTIPVADKQSVQVSQLWNRAKISGRLHMYCPVDSMEAMTLAPHDGNNITASLNVKVDLDKVCDKLTMVSIHKSPELFGFPLNGLNVLIVRDFTSITGSVGATEVVEIDYKPPVK